MWPTAPATGQLDGVAADPRDFGAEVTGVCSTDKLVYVTRLEAHHVIDYTRADGTRRYDRILDIAGSQIP